MQCKYRVCRRRQEERSNYYYNIVLVPLLILHTPRTSGVTHLVLQTPLLRCGCDSPRTANVTLPFYCA